MQLTAFDGITCCPSCASIECTGYDDCHSWRSPSGREVASICSAKVTIFENRSWAPKEECRLEEKNNSEPACLKLYTM